MAAEREMPMSGTIRLGHVGGIPIGLHYTWFLIAGLITLSLAGQFRLAHRDWNAVLIWLLALVTAVLFFATLLIHELSHALVARARSLPVRSITLFALGGVAHIEQNAPDAKTEFLVAVVGPLVSFAIGAACLAGAHALGWSLAETGSVAAGSVLGWLGSINIVLAIFNLIPGYPLDGGRVLRAILWGVYKDGSRATRNAARVGQAVAGVFIAWGLVQFFLAGTFGGLWLAFIGWFLLTAAQASYAEVSMKEALRGVKVADVMASDCAAVEPNVDVRTLVDDVLLRTGRRCVVVRSGGRVLGLVTPREVGALDRDRWTHVPVGDIMRPLNALKTVEPETPVTQALELMTREDVNQLPVVAAGRLEGMVTRAHILQLLKSRAELRAA